MRLALASLAALAVAACDTSGIHPLGRLRDALVPCEADALGRVETTSTWLRSTPTGTEVLLLGRPDPTAVVTAERPACWGRGTIEHDGSTHFAFGAYLLDGDGTGSATRAVEFVFEQQPDRPILGRDGAVRTDLPSPLSDPLSLALDGDGRLQVELGDDAMQMTSIADVVAAVDPSTQAGAEDLFRVVYLPLLTSQVRLLGFGSGAMTQYAGATAEFAGLIRNRFTVRVESLLSPNTTIAYLQLEDLSGLVLDGEQRSLVDTGGNGTMDGTLSYALRGTGVVRRGHVDYGALVIRDGFAAGGSYAFTVDGIAAPYTISYELATAIDLRAVLPVDAP